MAFTRSQGLGLDETSVEKEYEVARTESEVRFWSCLFSDSRMFVHMYMATSLFNELWLGLPCTLYLVSASSHHWASNTCLDLVCEPAFLVFCNTSSGHHTRFSPSLCLQPCLFWSFQAGTIYVPIDNTHLFDQTSRALRWQFYSHSKKCCFPEDRKQSYSRRWTCTGKDFQSVSS